MTAELHIVWRKILPIPMDWKAAQHWRVAFTDALSGYALTPRAYNVLPDKDDDLTMQRRPIKYISRKVDMECDYRSKIY